MGIAAAAVAVAAMAAIGVQDDLVLIVAAIAAVLIEAVIHRRGWRFTRNR